jgi:hypothetical protein
MRKEPPVYLPVQEHVREALKKKKGGWTYSQFLEQTLRIES